MTWRVGTKVPINVYRNNEPVCQTHTPECAAAIVAAMNSTWDAAKLDALMAEMEWVIGAPAMKGEHELAEVLGLFLDRLRECKTASEKAKDLHA